MSLLDALAEIVEDMEKDSQDDLLKNNFCGQVLKSYAKQIKRAIKASENSQKPIQVPNWEQEAKEEFRKKFGKDKVNFEEEFTGQQVEIVDGPLGSNDSVPNLWTVPAGGKKGSKAVLDNKYVYRLGEDNKLHFLEEETKELSGSIASSSKIILG